MRDTHGSDSILELDFRGPMPHCLGDHGDRETDFRKKVMSPWVGSGVGVAGSQQQLHK